jgi:carbon-monoxide dehydrogenase medium subunit
MTLGLKMLLPRFDFASPATLEPTLELLAEAGSEARLLAGGTDLLVKMKRGELAPRLVVSLARIPELARLAVSDSGLTLGPLCTMTELATSPLLTGMPAWAGLAEGAASVGGPIIRNRATVGGNIANARPCADTVPPLMTLGARLLLESRDRGLRTATLDGFITGPGQTALRSDEVLTGIELPAAAGPSGSSYLKITRRGSMEVTLVGCAASVTLDADGATVKSARAVLTSVAAVPLPVPDVQKALAGCAVGEPALEQALQEAAEAARCTARPIDDHRAPAFYRSEMAAVTARRALRAAVERAAGRAS